MSLQVRQLHFGYGDRAVLEHIDFNVPTGSHMAVVGESGGGKSTLLDLIYGLKHLEVGTVHWNEKQVLGPRYNLVPGEPYMKYLSQGLDLMPFTSVWENVSQYLSVFEQEHLRARTRELLQLVGMEAYADTHVRYLSGGQMQRVALARVLAQEPELLLLDEPFGQIDNLIKKRLRRTLFAYLREKGITVITATHDPMDVLPYADNALVLRDRQIVAQGSPKKLFNMPPDLYVASLFADAASLPVQWVKPYADPLKEIVLYAHELKLSDSFGMLVVVTAAYFKGSHYTMAATYKDRELFFDHSAPIPVGQEVYLNVSLETIAKRLGTTEHTSP